MIVTVGSTNETKVGAVREMIAQYPLFTGAEIVPVDVTVEQFGHPKNIEETVEGAVSRARQAFQECDYSFGIESGLMAVPYATSGYLEIGVCAIFDGKQFHIGAAPAFEWPRGVVERILEQGQDGSAAIRDAGFTDHQKIGTAGGVIGLLTNGRMNRKEQNKQAVMMALVQLEHPDKY